MPAGYAGGPNWRTILDCATKLQVLFFPGHVERDTSSYRHYLFRAHACGGASSADVLEVRPPQVVVGFKLAGLLLGAIALDGE
jgi:hypothetical protein